MAEIRITTNAADVNRWLNGNIKKVNQAAKAALSKTVMQVQAAERIELNKQFTVRKAAFIRNRVKIFKFPKATPEGLVAVIGIDGNVKGTPLLLSMFEDGGKRTPLSGNSVAVPITGGKARTVFKKSVAPSLRINKLAFQKRGNAMEGTKRTVILPTKGGKRVVFQRVGKGKNSQLMPMYVFERNVHLRKRIHFVKIARDLAEEQLPKLFNRYLRLYIKG